MGLPPETRSCVYLIVSSSAARPRPSVSDGDSDVGAHVGAAGRRRRQDAALRHAHVVEENFRVVADAPADLGHRMAHETGRVTLDEKRPRPVLGLRHGDDQLGEIADGLKVLGAVDHPGAVGLLDRARLEAGVLGGLGVVVEAQIRVGLVDGDRREIEVVVQKLRQEIVPLLLRHAQLEPVARPPRRQHEVIGRADVGGGQLLGDQAGGEVIGGAGAAVLFLQHEGPETELRAFFQRHPRECGLPTSACSRVPAQRA